MSKFWDTVKGVAVTNANKYVWAAIPKAQTDADYDDAPLQAERSYMRLFIAEMFLAKSRTWFKNWYPAVQVATQLKFGDQPQVEFSRLVQPPQNATKTGVLQNYLIMATTPFNGGTVEIEAALLAMQGANYLASAISVLEDFSSLVAPPLAQALTVAEKVSNGVDKLFNAAQGSVDLPYHDTFVGAGQGNHALTPGFTAVIKATPDQVDKSKLSVREGNLYYDGAPFRDYDYILLRLDGFEQRDDYMSLSDIATPYSEFLEALEHDRTDDAEAAKRSALAAARRSPDLARFDRRRVVEALKTEFENVESDMGYRAYGAAARSLDDIVKTWGMSMNQAVNKGDVRLAEIM